MSAPHLRFNQRHSLRDWLRHLLFGQPRRTRRDFSDVHRWAKLQRDWAWKQEQARLDPVQRLAEELCRLEAAEFRLEQVTALRLVQHLVPLAEHAQRELERALPQPTHWFNYLSRRRRQRQAAQVAQAVKLIEIARGLPDPETLRRRPVHWR